ncbi:MAG: uroporphyrinogen decarboxylase family protein, partial [Pikeienuella sp.]
QAAAHKLMNEAPEAFDAIIDRVADATIEYLSRQIQAGAEVVKLFDSWAGSLQGDAFERASLRPCLKIVEALRVLHPDVPVIGFPRGVGERALEFAKATGVAAIAIDQGADTIWARDNLQPITAVQGNLDPALMVTGGDALVRETEKLIETFADGPHIFNLGHGITPDADPANVEKLVRLVQG